MSQPAVLVYRDFLYPERESFLFRMAYALRDYKPVIAGLRILEEPTASFISINDGSFTGRLAELGMVFCGHPSRKWLTHIKSEAPRLVHAQFATDSVTARKLSRLLQIPMVIHCRGFDVTVHDRDLADVCYAFRQFVRQRKSIFREATTILTVSKSIRERVLAMGANPEKVHCHYTGIDTGLFVEDPGVERERIVLFVGRLIEKKGCLDAVHCAGLIQHSTPDVRFVFVGDGSLAGTCRKRADKDRLRCEFIGRQSIESTRRWMNRSSALIVPSMEAMNGDSEGLPNVVLEAQAMGLPVIAYRHGGIPEAITHGLTGLLVRERAINELANALQLLLANKPLWLRLRSTAHKNVLANFNLAVQSPLLERHYSATIAAFRSRRGALG